ncbi:unnamed protein product [Ectocarpus sp. CCAP 1310/34]|nr:unnamed protein product [Ectocarpus sp. CCAP 1310/34]CAB1118057.1 unnamed protein product [Ectocarpus sp. CCAP 1310/34]
MLRCCCETQPEDGSSPVPAVHKEEAQAAGVRGGRRRAWAQQMAKRRSGESGLQHGVSRFRHEPPLAVVFFGFLPASAVGSNTHPGTHICTMSDEHQPPQTAATVHRRPHTTAS